MKLPTVRSTILIITTLNLLISSFSSSVHARSTHFWPKNYWKNFARGTIRLGLGTTLPMKDRNVLQNRHKETKSQEALLQALLQGKKKLFRCRLDLYN